jgi:hypothetical protein
MESLGSIGVLVNNAGTSYEYPDYLLCVRHCVTPVAFLSAFSPLTPFNRLDSSACQCPTSLLSPAIIIIVFVFLHVVSRRTSRLRLPHSFPRGAMLQFRRGCRHLCSVAGFHFHLFNTMLICFPALSATSGTGALPCVGVPPMLHAVARV